MGADKRMGAAVIRLSAVYPLPLPKSDLTPKMAVVKYQKRNKRVEVINHD
jgi:hypothetical protein